MLQVHFPKFFGTLAAMYKNLSQIGSFAFIDLETTGLPSQEHNKTKITELSITIIESGHIELGVYPRVRNKLNLCLNPGKVIHPSATEITGLANDILENQPCFSIDVITTINVFLNLQKKPICFVAHNGNKFDYPILRAEINGAGGRLQEDILCIDSLLCFRDLYYRNEIKAQSNLGHCSTSNADITEQEEVDAAPKLKKLKVTAVSTSQIPNDDFDTILWTAVDEYENKQHRIQKALETTPKRQIMRTNQFQSVTPYQRPTRVSFKLGDIYKRLTSKDPVNAHHAEGDVDCLIHCAAIYGEEFVQWAKENAKHFSDIPPMRPGTAIGF